MDAQDGQARRYTGVAFNKKEGKWKARYCRSDGKRVWVNELFETAEDAARAYDAAVVRDGLPAQQLNFQDTAARATAALNGAEQGRSSPGGIEKLQGEVKRTKLAKPEPSTKKRKANEAVAMDTENATTEAAAAAAPPGQEPEGSGWEQPKMKKSKRREMENALRQKLQAASAAQQSVAPPKEGVEIGFALRAAVDVEAVRSPLLRRVFGLVNVCHAHESFAKILFPLAREADAHRQRWAITTLPKDDSTLGDELTRADAEPRLFALDCEMVICRAAGSKSSTTGTSTLARVSLVLCEPSLGEDGVVQTKFTTVVDEFVRTPEGLEVEDHLTHVSGVTAEHLRGATKTHDEARAMVTAAFGPRDIVVGHSLVADFAALRLWHGNLVDTSSLCAVKGLPTIMLSLKDLAMHVFRSDDAAVSAFQGGAAGHDSVADAEWSVRVLFKLMETADKAKQRLPLLLDDLPDRFKSRLSFLNLPATIEEKTVRAFVQHNLGSHAKSSFEVSESRKLVRKDGSVVSNIVVEFGEPGPARALFNALRVAQSGCGGYAKSGPCHAAGYPDRSGVQRKLVSLGGGELCEVVSYFAPRLSYRKTLNVKANVFGRIMGKGGRTVQMIQQVSGSRITVARQPERSSSDPDLAGSGDLLVEADSIPKLEVAVRLVHKAMRRELDLN